MLRKKIIKMSKNDGAIKLGLIPSDHMNTTVAHPESIIV